MISESDIEEQNCFRDELLLTTLARISHSNERVQLLFDKFSIGMTQNMIAATIKVIHWQESLKKSVLDINSLLMYALQKRGQLRRGRFHLIDFSEENVTVNQHRIIGIAAYKNLMVFDPNVEENSGCYYYMNHAIDQEIISELEECSTASLPLVSVVKSETYETENYETALLRQLPSHAGFNPHETNQWIASSIFGDVIRKSDT